MAKFEVLTDVEWGWCKLYRLGELGHVVMPGWRDDHGTKQFGQGVTLKPRELDALATKSAKVQALALIARECLALMRLRMEQDAGLGRDRVMERACDVLEATLAKFEHV